MKKLICAIVFALLSTAMFAQTQPAAKPASAEHKAKLHCYYMKDAAMQECWGTKGMAMAKDATLKNGTKVSAKGEVTMKDGKKIMLKEGECVLADNGKIGAFDKMHPKEHHMKDTKM